MSFKNYITESKRVFRNESPQKWAIIDTDVQKYMRKLGLIQIGVGILKEFAKKHLDKEFAFCDLYSNEKDKAHLVKLKSGERLCRYVSRVTIAGDMAPLCILNADTGKMRFMENSDIDNLEDLKWSKPQMLEYLRTTY